MELGNLGARLLSAPALPQFLWLLTGCQNISTHWHCVLLLVIYVALRFMLLTFMLLCTLGSKSKKGNKSLAVKEELITLSCSFPGKLK